MTLCNGNITTSLTLVIYNRQSQSKVAMKPAINPLQLNGKGNVVTPL